MRMRTGSAELAGFSTTSFERMITTGRNQSQRRCLQWKDTIPRADTWDMWTADTCCLHRRMITGFSLRTKSRALRAEHKDKGDYDRWVKWFRNWDLFLQRLSSCWEQHHMHPAPAAWKAVTEVLFMAEVTVAVISAAKKNRCSAKRVLPLNRSVSGNFRVYGWQFI